MLTRGKSRVVVRARHFHFSAESMMSLVRLSIGGIFQYFIGMASWIGMVRMVFELWQRGGGGLHRGDAHFHFRDSAQLGHGQRRGHAGGQNLGAHRPDRAEQSVWRAGLYNMCFLGLVAATFIIFARPLVSIFTNDPAVIPLAVNALRIVSYGYIFYAWGW